MVALLAAVPWVPITQIALAWLSAGLRQSKGNVICAPPSTNRSAEETLSITTQLTELSQASVVCGSPKLSTQFRVETDSEGAFHTQSFKWTKA